VTLNFRPKPVHFADILPCSERQIKTQINRWGLQKKVPNNVMAEVVRKRAQRRKFEKKESVFKFRKQEVPSRKIDDYVWRNRIDEEALATTPNDDGDQPGECRP
jgi:hypothetical protein